MFSFCCGNKRNVEVSQTISYEIKQALQKCYFVAVTNHRINYWIMPNLYPLSNQIVLLSTLRSTGWQIPKHYFSDTISLLSESFLFCHCFTFHYKKNLVASTVFLSSLENSNIAFDDGCSNNHSSSQEKILIYF